MFCDAKLREEKGSSKRARARAAAGWTTKMLESFPRADRKLHRPAWKLPFRGLACLFTIQVVVRLSTGNFRKRIRLRYTLSVFMFNKDRQPASSQPRHYRARPAAFLFSSLPFSLSPSSTNTLCLCARVRVCVFQRTARTISYLRYVVVNIVSANVTETENGR